MISYHVKGEQISKKFCKAHLVPFGTASFWSADGFHDDDDDGKFCDPPENAEEIIADHLVALAKAEEEHKATHCYESQGYYPKGYGKGRRREWATHMGNLSLEQAHKVYTWFSRMCEDPDYDSATAARIVNSLTKEVIDPPVLEQAIKIPGTKVKTISCTEAEFDATRRYHYGWGCYTKSSPRRGGGEVYTNGRDYVIGYKMPDGTYRIRPREWRSAGS